MIIVIPAYKPDEKLIKLIKNLKKISDAEIITVDDGGKSAYKAYFDECEKLGCTVLVHPENRGKGAALKTAFKFIRETRPDCGAIVTADADGQHLPHDIVKCLKESLKNPGALILGGRGFVGNVPLRSKVGNAISRHTFKILMGTKVYDTQTGLRAFTPDLLDDMISIVGDRYEYEMQMLCDCAKKKIPIKEVLIETVYIEENKSSHFNAWRDAKRVYGILFKNASGKVWEILTFILSSFVSFLIDIIFDSAFYIFLFSNIFSNTLVAVTVSLLCARIISAFTNYTINRKLVFHSHKSKGKSLLEFIILAVFVYLGNTLLDNFFFVTVFHAAEALKPISLVIAEIICFPISFVIQKKLVFKAK